MSADRMPQPEPRLTWKLNAFIVTALTALVVWTVTNPPV